LPSECVMPPPLAMAVPPPLEAKSAPSVKPEVDAGAAPATRLADIEKQHILRVLQSCDNNKKLAAEKLGIDRSTLYAKLRAYGILAQDADPRS
jgi:DNA-binding NtrC family response regulator